MAVNFGCGTRHGMRRLSDFRAKVRPAVLLRGIAGGGALQSAKHVTPMPDAHNLNDQTIVVHLVDDSIITRSHSKSAVLAGHRATTWRPRIVGKQIDDGSYSLLLLARQRL
ncbi:MAG TPA: hypothetical protein VFH54_05955 [Mycobacteriales bacterium]|nr:hypothetical protein [Mycobacteriales bacterium]